MLKVHESLTLAQSRWLVLAVVVAGTALFVAADVLIIRLWGLDCSISRVIGRLGTTFASVLLALAFWLGLMVGHFWINAQ